MIIFFRQGLEEQAGPEWGDGRKKNGPVSWGTAIYPPGRASMFL
jgi:hypothetical protein